MIVSKEITEKVRRYEKAKEEAEKLYKELTAYFAESMDGAYMEDFCVTDEVSGEDQGEGEYCYQVAGWCEDDFSGNYYYPTETGEYVAISYEC